MAEQPVYPTPKDGFRALVKACFDKDQKAIVAAIIGLAHTLGLRVCAEGVETESQLEFLQSCGMAIESPLVTIDPVLSATAKLADYVIALSRGNGADPSVAAGATLFQQFCVACHGAHSPQPVAGASWQPCAPWILRPA